MIIEIIAVVYIIYPYSIYSLLSTAFASLRMTPLKTAWTVVLGIQTTAKKSLSLTVYFFDHDITKVTRTLTVTPITMQITPYPKKTGLILEKSREAPTVPNNKA